MCNIDLQCCHTTIGQVLHCEWSNSPTDNIYTLHFASFSLLWLSHNLKIVFIFSFSLVHGNSNCKSITPKNCTHFHLLWLHEMKKCPAFLFAASVALTAPSVFLQNNKLKLNYYLFHILLLCKMRNHKTKS